MQLISLLRNDPWIPFSGRVIRHSMEDGPRLNENYHEAIRNQNRALVLQALNDNESVKELADATGLDYSTVKSHLDKLVKAGLVRVFEKKVPRTRKRIYMRVTDAL